MSMLMLTCRAWALPGHNEPGQTVVVLVVGFWAPFVVPSQTFGLLSLIQLCVPDSKFQPRQPPQTFAPSEQRQLPALQYWLDAHTPLQPPQ